jgi:hypothetical protein
MARRFVIGIPGTNDEPGLYPMKEWLRQNPENIPAGLDPNNSTSHQLRDGLRRAGWHLRETADQVILVPPATPHTRAPESEGAVSPERRVDVTPDDLGRWRRTLLQLLDKLDGGTGERRGVVSRIRSLSSAEKIPRVVAACMIVVVEVRNVSEYKARQLSGAQREAARICWGAVIEWAKSKNIDLAR